MATSPQINPPDPRARTDGVPAGLARLGEEALEAAAAAGPPAPHHVALPAQRRVALQAAEVLRVPAPALRLDALLHEDQLEGDKGPVPYAPGQKTRNPLRAFWVPRDFGAGMGLRAGLRKESFLRPSPLCLRLPAMHGAFNEGKRELKASPLPAPTWSQEAQRGRKSSAWCRPQ